jgi:hypothetical protein
LGWETDTEFEMTVRKIAEICSEELEFSGRKSLLKRPSRAAAFFPLADRSGRDAQIV